ncbi:hypothetical protein FRB96_003926 [Tulasnella sp. 330]|nr:hypothetical protein FRB96_003926 [Tulasnella sp. 330]KAG8880799.1 hypothetical protein FRB98_004735 [Tulasnella sp. 332]
MSSTAAPSGLDRLEKNVSQKVTAAPAQSQSTPVTVTISAACPNALACAPERTQTASFVKNAVKSINDMFDILNHPESASEYSDMQRVSYRTHGTIANYNLTAASTILSAWSASVAHHIDDINREISNTVTVEVALHEQMKGHTSMVQNVSSRISDATQHLKHESEILDKAQRRFVEEQEEYTKAV